MNTITKNYLVWSWKSQRSNLLFDLLSPIYIAIYIDKVNYKINYETRDKIIKSIVGNIKGVQDDRVR